MLLVTVLAFTVIFSGCGTFKHLDGSTERQIETFDEGRPAVVMAQEFEPVDISEMEAEPVEVAAMEETEPVVECPTCPPCPVCPPCPEVTRRPLSKIKIKVLNGNAKRGSAKKMSGKLEAMGYVVKRIDDAPRKSFTKNTVFYADCCIEEAKELKRKLGGRTVTKPLTWHSIFDIIVVTGKKP
jgi:hypothetical protein